jgi:hypothetical protein
MTDPLTFSSVDSNRAKAGVLRSKPAEREATEVALGSYIQLSVKIKQICAASCSSSELTARERRVAIIVKEVN